MRRLLLLSLLSFGCVGELTGTFPGDDGGAAAGADATPGAPDATRTIDAPPSPPLPPDAMPTGLAPEVQELFEIINAERATRGLVQVELRDDLVCAAARHSQDIGERSACTHDGSDGSGPGDRVADCGGPGWSGEIVACGYTTPRDAADGWIGSPGHNAIMFDDGQRAIGVGMHNFYWTAIFDR